MRSLKLSALTAILISLAPVSRAADMSLSDRFYHAIRADDAAAVERLLGSGADVNVTDGRGTTPLMYAAAFGSPQTMRRLIAAGARVNGHNRFEATALMWSTGDLEKVRLLVEKGADVNARSKRGRTPLLIAAAQGGNLEVVRFLLAKGAVLPKGTGPSPLVEAAAANDTPMVKLFLERGEDPNAKNPDGFTPLIFAAGHGNVDAMKMLIARGAGVNGRSGPSFSQPVKNGSIALGYLTPLLLASAAGSPETVRVLLDAGADVNARDIRGMTPLMLAVATDHASERIVRMLLSAKADTSLKSKDGETALDWASKFRHPSIFPLIQASSPGLKPAGQAPPAVEPASTTDLSHAVERTLAALQKSNVSFFQRGGCISCHAQNITSMATGVARNKGVHFDRAAAAEAARATRLQFAAFADGMLERLDPPAVEILTYTLIALEFEGAEPDRITDALVHNIAAQQHADGSWGVMGIARPPITDGGFSITATALRALRHFAPPARRAEMERRAAKGAAWLMKAEPRTTEDAVMQLLGAHWAGLNRERIDSIARRVLGMQRQDGGWAQTPYLASDAYATGSALYALHEAGALTSAAPAYRKGVAFLLRTQAADGSWYVASRSPKFQPYFDGGFPYGHNQWVSQMGTGWAGIALSLAIPDQVASR